MQTSGIKKKSLEIICFLFILLFIYAAVNKLLDFETFQVQLAQSPLLSAFAGWVSILVPLIEVIVSAMLLFPKTRLLGLFSALWLMAMFTTYIFVVLHFSSFVPCSCGGILEKMSWNVHLVFNSVFIFLALIGLLLYDDGVANSKYKTIFTTLKQSFLLLLFSIAAVVILFLSSEEILHRNNPFIRRYIRQTVKVVYKTDLKYNSYYFAGASESKIYLGNLTDPFGVLSIDTLKNNKIEHRINFIDNGEPFRRIFTKVKPPYFYLLDGTVPSFSLGKINDWKVRGGLKNLPRYTSGEPIDSISIAFRNNTGKKAANILGVYRQNSVPEVKYFPKLLQQQIDGIFDTDGMLLYNDDRKEIIYVYYYRNEFIMFDKDGKFRRGNTIDTITKAKIKVADLKNHTQRRLSAPPFFVNALTTTKKNLLFIHSKVPGRFENQKNWKEANVIDVYDIEKKTYLVSFPIYTLNGIKIKGILATNTHFYVLSGNDLYVYSFKGILKKNLKQGKGGY
jgi:hypothetical protein